MRSRIVIASLKSHALFRRWARSLLRFQIRIDFSDDCHFYIFSSPRWRIIISWGLLGNVGNIRMRVGLDFYDNLKIFLLMLESLFDYLALSTLMSMRLMGKRHGLLKMVLMSVASEMMLLSEIIHKVRAHILRAFSWTAIKVANFMRQQQMITIDIYTLLLPYDIDDIKKTVPWLLFNLGDFTFLLWLDLLI